MLVDKNHDLASQVVVAATAAGDAGDAKQKRRRRSRCSSHRDDDGHRAAKPPCRDIGVQVEILPMPKKSPGRFLSFGKRAESSNGFRRVSGEIELSEPSRLTKSVDLTKADEPAPNVAPAPAAHVAAEKADPPDNPEQKRGRLSKKSLKNREKNIFNKVRKMSQFISALKSSKRRKEDEPASQQQQHSGHNGQCCVHRDSDAPRDATFAGVTFEERPVKDAMCLGLPAINDKHSKVLGKIWTRFTQPGKNRHQQLLPCARMNLSM
jgi:hypothetical protein